MRVVLDTSVLVDHLRGVAAASEYVAGLEEQPASSEISRIEVIQGLRSEERQAAEMLFDLIDWIPVTEVVARRAGQLGRSWRRSHPGIGVADLTVAGTAELIGAAVATQNIRHFPMFPTLRGPY